MDRPLAGIAEPLAAAVVAAAGEPGAPGALGRTLSEIGPALSVRGVEDR